MALMRSTPGGPRRSIPWLIYHAGAMAAFMYILLQAAQTLTKDMGAAVEERQSAKSRSELQVQANTEQVHHEVPI